MIFKMIKNGIIESKNGTKHWYVNNKLHREDGPAIERSDGTKHWFLNGKLHRKDGPAVEYNSNMNVWFSNLGPYTESAPSLEWESGNKMWFLSGFKHGIQKIENGINIGCETKSSIEEWDEWFSGTETYKYSRDSNEFKTLLKLWAQFKRQVREY